MVVTESVQTLQAWRAEIEAELAAAKKASRAVELEHATAVTAARTAETAHREVQTLLDGAFTRLTGPLGQRLSWLRSEVDEAKARAARAAGALKTARDLVAELQRALVQLDHIAPASDAEEAA